MEWITSTKNPYIKELKSLKDKKYREELEKFIAEGEKCALEALAYADVESVLVTEECSELASKADQKGVRVCVVNQAVLEAVSDVKTLESALAVVRKRRHEPEMGGGLYVALENVGDPRNVGTTIRTADAVGARAVILSGQSADYTGPKAVRAAMGSIFHVDILVKDDFIEYLSGMKKEGMFFVAGHLKGQSGPIEKKEKLCVLIGNEARGLSGEAVQLADLLYKISIYGNAESLNAAVAAGILLYRCKEGI